jgi:hypothetical protein
VWFLKLKLIVLKCSKKLLAQCKPTILASDIAQSNILFGFGGRYKMKFAGGITLSQKYLHNPAALRNSTCNQTRKHVESTRADGETTALAIPANPGSTNSNSAVADRGDGKICSLPTTSLDNALTEPINSQKSYATKSEIAASQAHTVENSGEHENIIEQRMKQEDFPRHDAREMEPPEKSNMKTEYRPRNNHTAITTLRRSQRSPVPSSSSRQDDAQEQL